MDWLTFVSSIVDSLAWPLAIFLGFVLLRKPIRELLPSLKRLKYKDIEAEFGKELASIKQIEGPEGELKQLSKYSNDLKVQKLLSIASVAPNAAVLETFKEIEFETRQRLNKEGINHESSAATPYRLMQRLLEAKNILKPKDIKIFNELRTMRNKVAHAGEYEISHDQASEYIEIAFSLIDKIKH